MTPTLNILGLVGTGVMGSGIAQIAAQAGLTVRLFDARDGAARSARTSLAATFDKLVAKGKIEAVAAAAALERLQVADTLEALADCDVVVEAIIERLDAKQELLTRLEAIVSPDCILATNTSSLSVTAIARACQTPERVAGFHFFNPVPLMKVVDVIDGLATDPAVGDALLALAERMGHRGVRAKDTPGFIVNHLGRAYGTEALKIHAEGVAPRGAIDRIEASELDAIFHKQISGLQGVAQQPVQQKFVAVHIQPFLYVVIIAFLCLLTGNKKITLQAFRDHFAWE